MSKITIKPLHNNVVVLQDETKATASGNIIVPDIGKEKPLEGVVVEVGEGAYTLSGALIPTTLKKGDRILFPPMGALRINVGGIEYITIKETDIIAKIKTEDNE